MQKTNFKSHDGVKIYANLFTVNDPKKYVILLHMMPAIKESWNIFAQKLNEAGMSALAIDLRGHGESTEDGALDYNQFNNEDHQKYRLDVEAAIDFLKKHDATTQNIYLCGASIGANLTIDFMAKYDEIERGVALSPGLDYKGIAVEDAILKLKSNQKIFLVASDEDEYSFQSAIKLNEKNPNNTALKKFENSGHGTTIFEKHPEFMDELIIWLNN